MRSPPMTSGYSRPSSPLTFASAASIAALFSGLLKSVSASFLKSGRGVIRESFRLLHGRETHVIDFGGARRDPHDGLHLRSAMARRARRHRDQPRLPYREQSPIPAERDHRRPPRP